MLHPSQADPTQAGNPAAATAQIFRSLVMRPLWAIDGQLNKRPATIFSSDKIKQYFHVYDKLVVFRSL